MLRNSRRNPMISAHSMMKGNFDFNKAPLAPPGTKVIVHEKINRRHTWVQHEVQVWYIVPAVKHYQFHKA